MKLAGFRVGNTSGSGVTSDCTSYAAESATNSTILNLLFIPYINGNGSYNLTVTSFSIPLSKVSMLIPISRSLSPKFNLNSLKKASLSNLLFTTLVNLSKSVGDNTSEASFNSVLSGEISCMYSSAVEVSSVNKSFKKWYSNLIPPLP